MAADPPHDEIAREMTDPASVFLCALWEEMDPAEDLATAQDGIRHMPQVQAHLEAAVALIRQWRAEQHPSGHKVGKRDV